MLFATREDALRHPSLASPRHSVVASSVQASNKPSAQYIASQSYLVRYQSYLVRYIQRAREQLA